MNNSWKVLYYVDGKDNIPVEAYINSLPMRQQAKILSFISLLEERGPNLPRPYADLLKNGIHELRIKVSGDQIRILYFFCYRDYIVLTNVFEKHTKAVPENEIKKAIECRENFLQRFSKEKLEGGSK